MKGRIVTLMVHLYPASWRAEYGQELAAILSSRSLSASIVIDTLKSALFERVRVSEPWGLIGVVLLAVNLCATVTNSIAPIPGAVYLVYERLTYIPLIVGICWTTIRGAGLRRTIVAACKIVLLSNATDLLIIMLWLVGIIHPAIVGLRDLPSRPRFDIALLAFRSTLPAPVRAVDLAWQLPTFMLMAAVLNGCLGWTIVRAIRFTVIRFRRIGER